MSQLRCATCGGYFGRHKIIYSNEAVSHALSLWEVGYANAHGKRPWLEDYERAVRQVLPELDRYRGLGELVVAFYDFALRVEAERACHLDDGRILDVGTVEDACFWQRYVALTRPGTAEESIKWTR